MSNCKRGSIYENCYATLAYIMTGRKFTINSLAEHLDCDRRNASRHLDAASMYFPIIEVEPPSYGIGIRGRKAAIFQMIKDD